MPPIEKNGTKSEIHIPPRETSSGQTRISGRAINLEILNINPCNRVLSCNQPARMAGPEPLRTTTRRSGHDWWLLPGATVVDIPRVSTTSTRLAAARSELGRQAGLSVVTRFVAQTGGAESTVPPLPVARCLAVCAPHDLSVGQVDARRGRRASGSRARTIQEVRLPSLFYCNDSRVPRGLVGRLPTAWYRR